MLPFRLIYHDDYNLDFGDHVFPAHKYGLLQRRLLAEGFCEPSDFLAPEPASDGDLLLVHTPEWIDRLRNGKLSPLDILRLEIPYTPEMVDAVLLATGGSILAARCALEQGIGLHIGGGFHHAFPGHGEGFCAINDIAVAVRRAQRDGQIARAMVVDCDVHHGNGTAAIFAGDAAVFTLSIHQWNNYPPEKPPSTVDIHLPDGVGDDEYLERLGAALVPALDQFRPDLILYVAGADPYEEDRLGGLKLTMAGLRRRDRLVLEAARSRAAPVAVVLAGGYASDPSDTVAIHANTARVAKEVFGAAMP